MDEANINLWISLIITIIVGVFYFISLEFRMLVVSIGIAAIVFLYLSDHTEKIRSLKIEFKRLNEKVNIYERLSKLEAKIK